MTKKNEISAQLREREERRKNSVVSNMISAPPQQPTSLQNRHNASEQGMVKDESGDSVLVIKKGEIKSRRKQILLHPSIHDKAAEKCKRLGISMNDVINQLLERWSKTE